MFSQRIKHSQSSSRVKCCEITAQSFWYNYLDKRRSWGEYILDIKYLFHYFIYNNVFVIFYCFVNN